MTSWPASLAGLGDLNGFNVAYATAATVTVSVGYGCTDTTYNPGHMIASAAMTIDITAAGALGLDAGAEAANTWYHVWVIGDIENGTVSAMFSTSNTAPTMPGAYTLKRRVGEVRNDNGQDLLDIHQCGNGNRREIFYLEEPVAIMQVLNGGNAVVWTDIDCSAFVPPGCDHVKLWAETHVKDTHFRAKGATHCQKHVNENHEENFSLMCDADQIVQYLKNAAAGSVDVSVAGYVMKY